MVKALLYPDTHHPISCIYTVRITEVFFIHRCSRMCRTDTVLYVIPISINICLRILIVYHASVYFSCFCILYIVKTVQILTFIYSKISK